MSLRCLLGFHRISLSSIVIRPDGHVGLCESCARPLERKRGGEWVASEPLDLPRQRAA